MTKTHPFVYWRDSFCPEGEVMEDVERSCSVGAWDGALQTAMKEVAAFKGLLNEEDTDKAQSVVAGISELKVGLNKWNHYIPPPAGGCGSAPDKKVESMMVEFWNSAMELTKIGFEAVLPRCNDIYYQELQNSIDGLKYGNTGCGSCGSSGGCSSKN